MKNKIFKFFTLLIAILMVIPFGAMSISAEEDIEGISIAYYKVVYSGSASAETQRVVKAFGEYLTEYCKAEVEVVTDTGTKASDKEIIIGNTNRPAGSDVVLREKDWCVYADGNKIYINAYSEGALPLAIEWFKHNCLINGSRKAYVGEGYFYSYEYEFDYFKIAGIVAKNLVIAYDKKDHTGFVDVAYSLAYSFMDRNGLSLNVEAVATREQPQLIIVSTTYGEKYLPEGVSVGESEYFICKSGKDIAIVADSSYGAELAVQKIIEKLYTVNTLELTELCTKTPVGYTIGVDTLPLTYGADYRFMSFNPGRYHLIQIDRCDEVMATMAYYAPDIVGFQEYCDYFSRNMTPKLSKLGYTMIGDELCKNLPENQSYWLLKYNMTPIAYKTDRFYCIASGWRRLNNTYDPDNGRTYYGHQITWAVLEDKATGETFGVTSTHFFHLSDRTQANPVRAQNAKEVLELVQGLREEYGCEFISMGDYNSYGSDEAYKLLEGSDMFRDSRDVSLGERTVGAAGHTINAMNTSKNDCIDLLFTTDNVNVIRNRIAANEIAAPTGDHFPIYIDVTIGDKNPDYVPTQPQFSMTFPSVSASKYISNSSLGYTTVGYNTYAPKVVTKTEPPLEEDEFWDMKFPPVEEPSAADQNNTTGLFNKFGCGGTVGCSMVVLVAISGVCACTITRKKKGNR